MTVVKPWRCPHCGGERILTIVYSAGKPDGACPRPDAMVLYRAHPTGNDPAWHCCRCHLEWGHPQGFSGTSSNNEELA